MRLFFGCAAVLALAVGGVTAQDKKADVDATKLVGRWGTQTKGKAAAAAPVEQFTKDGKYTLGTANGKLALEGTYQLEGNALTITLPANPGSPAETHKWFIKKLTDTSLTYSEGKKTVTLQKLK